MTYFYDGHDESVYYPVGRGLSLNKESIVLIKMVTHILNEKFISK